jgi:hypothetical protein
MSLFPDLILIFVFALSLVVYLLFKILNSTAGYRQHKSQLLGKYQELRNKSIALQEKLSLYILSGDILKEPFINEMTYGEYLRYLQRNHANNLTDKGYTKLKKSNNRFYQKRIAEILIVQEKTLNDAEKVLADI